MESIEARLIRACKLGEAEAVTTLLEQGANIEAKSYVEWTPLHVASRNGHVRVVEVLLKNGADPEAKDKDGRTPKDLVDSEGVLKLFEDYDSLDIKEPDC